MQKEEIKFQNSLYFEGMTSIRAIIRGIDNGTNTRKIKEIYYDKARMDKIHKEVGYLRAVADKYGYTLIESDADFLEEKTLGNSHGGLVALCEKRELPSLACRDIKPDGFYAMIQGIEDPYNFGYALRSLYACGCDAIILGKRNWLGAAGVVCRSSAGASEMFKIYECDEIEAAEKFSACGYNIVCADERTDNLLGQCEIPYPTLLIVGGEKRGINRALIEKATMLVKIPYAREFKASLSAASATTMFAYEIMRQKLTFIDKNIH